MEKWSTHSKWGLWNRNLKATSICLSKFKLLIPLKKGSHSSTEILPTDDIGHVNPQSLREKSADSDENVKSLEMLKIQTGFTKEFNSFKADVPLKV
ncbi:hypothetical protein AVEN_48600-1 [Araneus ventricosus]|uniref:Uncharacterized protein n=1 Tax=Araneus ventricosus TaxID=182803 RepID=A0A4Y2N1F0_ARAVE|nr:hypothetical protein AVEN_48600-1 [Araneus ventricosus]